MEKMFLGTKEIAEACGCSKQKTFHWLHLACMRELYVLQVFQMWNLQRSG